MCLCANWRRGARAKRTRRVDAPGASDSESVAVAALAGVADLEAALPALGAAAAPPAALGAGDVSVAANRMVKHASAKTTTSTIWRGRAGARARGPRRGEVSRCAARAWGVRVTVRSRAAAAACNAQAPWRTPPASVRRRPFFGRAPWTSARREGGSEGVYHQPPSLSALTHGH